MFLGSIRMRAAFELWRYPAPTYVFTDCALCLFFHSTSFPDMLSSCFFLFSHSLFTDTYINLIWFVRTLSWVKTSPSLLSFHVYQLCLGRPRNFFVFQPLSPWCCLECAVLFTKKSGHGCWFWDTRCSGYVRALYYSYDHVRLWRGLRASHLLWLLVPIDANHTK